MKVCQNKQTNVFAIKENIKYTSITLNIRLVFFPKNNCMIFFCVYV